MFDHDDGVARIDEAVEHTEELVDVFEVEPRGRFVEDVQGLSGRALRQLGRELHPLSLASRQCGGRLTELYVIQSDIVERVHVTSDRWDRLEELRGLRYSHVEDLRDVLSLVAHLEGLPVVSLPLAHLTRDVDVR